MKTAAIAKVMHNAIPSDLEGISFVDDEEVLFRAVVVDMFSISSLFN